MKLHRPLPVWTIWACVLVVVCIFVVLDYHSNRDRHVQSVERH